MSNPLSLNLYTYVYNNPLKYTDPSGHDAYFFYGLAHGENGGFSERAEIDAKRWEEENGTKAHLYAITSEEDFIAFWDSMGSGGVDIELVSLYFHSNAQNIIIDYTKGEYLTTNASGLTPGGSSATWIGLLLKHDINTLILYACNSAHQNYRSSNLAVTFMLYQNVNEVYGWDGSMKWSGKNGDTMLSNSQDYFESHLPNGVKRDAQGLIRYYRVGSNHFGSEKVNHYKKNWQGKRVWDSIF